MIQTRAPPGRAWQFQRRQRDEEIASQGGWIGTAAGLAAGALDPSFYIPLLGELHGAQAGAGFLRGAGRMANVGALQSSVSENALQASQPSRTWQESAGNIATNTLMMGIFGGALAHLAPAERDAAEDSFEQVRRAATPVERTDPSSMSSQGHISLATNLAREEALTIAPGPQ